MTIPIKKEETTVKSQFNDRMDQLHVTSFKNNVERVAWETKKQIKY